MSDEQQPGMPGTTPPAGDGTRSDPDGPAPPAGDEAGSGSDAAGAPPPSWPAPTSTDRTAPPPPPPPPSPSRGRSTTGGWSGGRIIPLRALRLGEILDSSFRLYRATFLDVTILVLITLGIFQVLVGVAQGRQPNPLTASSTEVAVTSDQVGPLLVAGLLAVVGQLFVYPIVRGAATTIALERDRGGDHSWQSGLRAGLRIAGRLLGVGFLVLLIALAALLVLGVVVVLPVVLLVAADLVFVAAVVGLVGGVVTIVVLTLLLGFTFLAVPVMVVEDAGAVASLRRSFALVRPQWPRVVGIVVLTSILLGIVGGIVGAAGLVFLLFGSVVGTVGNIVVTTLALALTVPFEANVALLLYTDARVRVEGLDVEVLTAELERT